MRRWGRSPPTIDVNRAMLKQAHRDPPNPGREHRWPRGREHRRSESRPAAIADDSVLLPARVLLDEHEARRPIPSHQRRVRRPGVDVRARRGYRAATAEEVNASRAAAARQSPKRREPRPPRSRGWAASGRNSDSSSTPRRSASRRRRRSAQSGSRESSRASGGVRDRRQRHDRSQRRFDRRRIDRHAEAGRAGVPRQDSSAGRDQPERWTFASG